VLADEDLGTRGEGGARHLYKYTVNRRGEGAEPKPTRHRYDDRAVPMRTQR